MGENWSFSTPPKIFLRYIFLYLCLILYFLVGYEYTIARKFTRVVHDYITFRYGNKFLKLRNFPILQVEYYDTLACWSKLDFIFGISISKLPEKHNHQHGILQK